MHNTEDEGRARKSALCNNVDWEHSVVPSTAGNPVLHTEERNFLTVLRRRVPVQLRDSLSSSCASRRKQTFKARHSRASCNLPDKHRPRHAEYDSRVQTNRAGNVNFHSAPMISFRPLEIPRASPHLDKTTSVEVQLEIKDNTARWRCVCCCDSTFAVLIKTFAVAGVSVSQPNTRGSPS